MILVDTSVLIDYFTDRQNEQVDKLESIFERDVPFCINSFIYLEVLMGARNQEEFHTLHQSLSTQQFYDLKHRINSYEQAAKIYADCRRQGLTIASVIDCLIAQTALEHDLQLLHRDEDFNRMAKIVPLKIY